MAKQNQPKSVKVPDRIYAACEAEAVKRRKKTGKLIRWTDIMVELLDKSLGIKPNSRS